MYTINSYRNNLIISPFLQLQLKHFWWSNVRWELVKCPVGISPTNNAIICTFLIEIKTQRCIQHRWSIDRPNQQMTNDSYRVVCPNLNTLPKLWTLPVKFNTKFCTWMIILQQSWMDRQFENIFAFEWWFFLS